VTNSSNSNDESKSDETLVTCRICDDDEVEMADSTANPGCGHRFCNDCWSDYLVDKISKGKEAVVCQCPSHKCPAVVSDNTIRRLVPPDHFAKLNQSVLRSFIEDDKNFRWCPAPGCEFAVKGRKGLLTVKCNCGHKFCFTCSEEFHMPASCQNLQTWLEKCSNDSETAHWIIANTKKCPKCRIRIEKNQGCNHMTCKGCQYDFCWVCMGAWGDHGNHTGGYYKCNKYDPKKKAAEGSNKEGGSVDQAKAELDRYLHYYQRYHNHDQSKKFARRQRDATEKRMNELQSQNNDGSSSSSSSSMWVDVQFLHDATEQVFECRQVLKYTYVFAYYLDDGSEKELFEFLQQQLEASTEHLSEMSEAPIEKLDKTEVANYTRITENFMKKLLEGVANGLTSS